MLFVWLRLSFLVLEFLPREAKKPLVAFVPAAEMEAEYDNDDPIIVE
jgi:hypothetical protein